MTAATHSGPHWEVAKVLAQRLVAAGAVEVQSTDVIDLQPEIDELIARGVLVEVEGKVRFFHQNFLDYVVARDFAERGESLLEYVEEAEEDLRIRAVVRRVLEYMRADDHRAFASTAQQLLNAPVRFFVKDVVFSLLQLDDQPSPVLWPTLRSLVLDPETVGHEAAWGVLSQPGWIRWIDRSGELPQWMASEEESERSAAAEVLRNMQSFDSGRAARLLTPFVGRLDWNDRLRWLMRFVNLHEDRQYFDLITSALGAGAFDAEGTAADASLWFAVRDLPKEHPDWAVELLESYLQRLGRTWLLNLAQDRFGLGDRDHWAGEFAAETATAAPREFVNVVLPVVLETVVATASESLPDGVRFDPLWGYRWINGREMGLSEALYTGVDDALCAVARSKPRSFRKSFEPVLLEHVTFHSAAFLLFRAWAANPKMFWPQALALVTENDSVRRCGYPNSPYWVTRELIEACAPHADSATIVALETALLSFYPHWERSPEGHPESGHAQYVLLQALGNRLTSQGAKRLRELQDKFGGRTERQRGIVGGFVGPPISEAAALKMTDAQWLRAIRKYGTDEARELLKGGAVELSRLLEARTQEDPARFAALSLRFPDDVNEHYIDAVLRGLGTSEKSVQAEHVFDVVRHAFRLPAKPGGRWIVRPLSRVVSDTEEVPKDIVDIVVWFATEHPDPSEELAKITPGTSGPYYGGDLLTAGINTVRGAAAEALAQILWSSPSLASTLADPLERLAKDPILAVRACAAWTIASVARHDLDFALRLFDELTRTDDELLAAQPVEQLTGNLAQRRFDAVRGVLVRMLESPRASVQRAGGRQAALARLATEQAQDLANSAIAGEVEARLGLAEVAAANISNPEVCEPCIAWLETLFNDPDQSVREASARWCWNVEGGVGPLLELARAYVNTPAHAENEHALLQLLDETKDVPVADIALRAAEVFVEQHTTEISDARRAFLDSSVVSRLVFRAYASADTPEFRVRCLDIIDRLLAARVRDVEKLVEQVELAAP